MLSGLTLAAARALEDGRVRFPFASSLSDAWAHHARVARPVRLPADARVVGVGGATLGGSYKTPVVLGLARALGALGERVAVAAHGYGARPGAPRLVGPDADVRDVGDDALLLARALSPREVPVVVGSARAEVLAFAAERASIVVADALLQTRPRRLACSVLVLDGAAPFGAGVCPPRGDSRASPDRLLEAADVVVTVRDAAAPLVATLELPERLATIAVTADVPAAVDAEGRRAALAALAPLSLGVVLCIARPGRVLRSLHARGIRPVECRLFPDHAVPIERAPRGEARRGRSRIDAWLTTPKCATKLGAFFEGAPVWSLDLELRPVAR